MERFGYKVAVCADNVRLILAETEYRFQEQEPSSTKREAIFYDTETNTNMIQWVLLLQCSGNQLENN